MIKRPSEFPDELHSHSRQSSVTKRLPYATALTTKNRVRQTQDFKMGEWAGIVAALVVFNVLTLVCLECSSLRRRRPRHQPREKCVWRPQAHVQFVRETDGISGTFAASRARGEYLRTHFKNMREVAAALTGQ